MPFTLHAGECGSVQNIVDSVKAGAGRIGHGIAMRGHYNIQKELADRGIGIEMCPISNLQDKSGKQSVRISHPGISEHRIEGFHKHGQPYSEQHKPYQRASVHPEHVWHSGGRDTADDEECSGYAFATDEVKARLYSELGIKG